MIARPPTRLLPSLYLLLGAMLLQAPSPAVAVQSDERSLSRDVPIEREIKGGEAHVYRVNLSSGQFLRVRVDQRGVNLVLALMDSLGKPVAESASHDTTRGLEFFFAVAPVSGEYRLEVRPAKQKQTPGEYEITVVELREAGPRDEKAIKAAQRAAEALRQRLEGTLESLRESLAKYAEALVLWKEAGNGRQEAVTLDGIGKVHFALRENEKAIDAHTQALTLMREMGDKWGQAEALNNIGEVYNALNDHRKALEYYRLALPVSRDARDRWGEAMTLNNIGWTHWALDEHHDGLEMYKQALPIFREVGDQWNVGSALNNIGFEYALLALSKEALEFYGLSLAHRREVGDRPGEAQTLSNLGTVYWQLGDIQNALEHYDKAVAIQRIEGDRRREGHSLGNAAGIYKAIGERQKALDYFARSLELLRETGDRRAEAIAYDRIGEMHQQLGEFDTALRHYEQALTIKRDIKDRSGEAVTLDKIGVVHRSMGDARRALDFYQQALPLSRAATNRYGEGLTLSNMGTAFHDLGETQKALEHYNNALEIQRDLGERRGEGGTLAKIAAVYESAGDQAQAAVFYHRALALHRAVLDREGEAHALFGVARVSRNLGRLDEARARIESAIHVVELLRTKIAGLDWRTSYLATNLDAYKFYIDVLMQQHRRDPAGGYAEAALGISERARARTLLEGLTEARAGILEGVEPGLLERESQLSKQINLQAERLTQLLGGKHTEAQASAARKELDARIAEYQNVQAEIRARSPRYAALTQPQPLTARKIQSELIDPGTLLLEYSLGDERSYVWALTSAKVKAHELPGRAKIEAAARRVYELLTERNKVKSAETSESRLARVREADAQYREAALSLSRMILQPVAGELGSKRLVVVAEGLLQYLPFAALPDPASVEAKGGERLPLVAKREVITLPSASVLAVLRKELAGREPAPLILAVLADPVFESKDPRVEIARARAGSREPSLTSAKTVVAQTSHLERSAEESGAGELKRLYFSSREAKQIAALAPEGRRLVSLDFAASLDSVKGANLSKYRIVHFATHGLLNNRHPELSGIVLSLVDERGRPRDGFLRLNEIYKMKLNADLVVLSACQTALGKETKGEGLVGITRGFMYAGAQRVVASLWKVDDRATAELMALFYKAMLEQKLSPAAALRRAQTEMSIKWPSPYYWAGFTLQGEWR